MRVVEFGSLFQFIRNGMSVKQDKSGDGLPITRIETIADATIDENRVGYAGVNDEEGRRWLLESGDILFSHINSVEHVGKCAVYRGVPEKLVHGMNLLCLRSDQTQLLPEFAKYLIRSPGFRARLQNFINKAVNQASVSIGNLKPIPVGIPPLPDQRRIAAILDQAEALRVKRREALAQLDSLTQSIFIEMFGDPVSNPKNWMMLPFSEACETRLGKMLDARQQTGQDKRRYLRNANVQWFRVDLYDLLEMDFDSDARRTFNLQMGDLLICEGGEPGRAAVWQGQLEDIYFQKALHRGRPKAGIAAPEYLVWLLWFLAHNGGLGDHVTAATIAHLTGEKLKAMPIPVPPLGLQQNFATRLQSLDALKATHCAALQELDSLFASLQHRAFRGEL